MVVVESVNDVRVGDKTIEIRDQRLGNEVVRIKKARSCCNAVT